MLAKPVSTTISIVRVVRVQQLHAGQARGAAELQVDHRVAGRCCVLQHLPTSSIEAASTHLVAAALERALRACGRSRRRPRRSAANGQASQARPPIASVAQRQRQAHLGAAFRPVAAVTLPPSVRTTFTTRNRPSPPPGAALARLIGLAELRQHLRREARAASLTTAPECRPRARRRSSTQSREASRRCRAR